MGVVVTMLVVAATMVTLLVVGSGSGGAGAGTGGGGGRGRGRGGKRVVAMIVWQRGRVVGFTYAVEGSEGTGAGSGVGWGRVWRELVLGRSPRSPFTTAVTATAAAADNVYLVHYLFFGDVPCFPPGVLAQRLYVCTLLEPSRFCTFSRPDCPCERSPFRSKT